VPQAPGDGFDKHQQNRVREDWRYLTRKGAVHCGNFLWNAAASPALQNGANLSLLVMLTTAMTGIPG
jgi:hypothetical protein